MEKVNSFQDNSLQAKGLKVNILNLSLDSLPLSTLLDQLKEGGVVYTPNVDHLIQLQFDSRFYEAYQSVTYRLCDSQILFYASRLINQPILEKISGSDLFPAFYNHFKDDLDTRLFLLGGGEGVAEQAQLHINHKVGRSMVVGTYCPPFGFESDAEECQRILNAIEASNATVLAVGLGAPKQELWIAQYRDRLPQIKTFLAIGATLDFEAGTLARAPRWMQQAGLEWFYRLTQEPQRLWHRYILRDSQFFWLLLLQCCGYYRNPFDTSPPAPSQPAILAHQQVS
jgi:N-acetylglucosaminyldiphosphoundecaprenol N-acetyl-beta-D-mannosaminyltransferase